MVSKHGLELLRWMKDHDTGEYFWNIRKQCGLEIEYELLLFLCKEGYITSWEPPNAIPTETDYDIPEVLFRISDAGVAYVEDYDRQEERRLWELKQEKTQRSQFRISMTVSIIAMLAAIAAAAIPIIQLLYLLRS